MSIKQPKHFAVLALWIVAVVVFAVEALQIFDTHYNFTAAGLAFVWAGACMALYTFWSE